MLPGDDVAQVKNDDADWAGWWWWRWWRHKQMVNHEWNCVDCSLLSVCLHFGAWLKCDDDDGNDDADDGGTCRLIISAWALYARLAWLPFLLFAAHLMPPSSFPAQPCHLSRKQRLHRHLTLHGWWIFRSHQWLCFVWNLIEKVCVKFAS